MQTKIIMDKGGRPLKFTAKELQEKIDAYFAMCDETGKPYTITGMAVAIESSRESLLNYSRKEEFFDTIKKAKEKIHAFTEEHLYKSGIATGVIFNLKNNWGWKDKQEIEQTNETKITISKEEQEQVTDLINNLGKHAND